jgi:predicted amino acid racemase
VIENETGIFFEEQNPASIVKTIKTFDIAMFNPQKIRAQAERFSKDLFKEKIKSLVESEYENFKHNQ